MLSLIIESSTERGIVALVKNHSLLQKIELPIGLQNSHYLLPEIKHLLEHQGVTPAELTSVAVGIGPGSYTGIRVGVAVAKTITYAVKIPLIGICTLAAFIPDEDTSFASLIDAKIGGAYYLIGERKGNQIVWKSEPQVAPLEQLEKLADVGRVITPTMQPLRLKLEKQIPAKRWHWQELPPNPLYMDQLATEKLERGEFSTDGHLDLLYLRKTQAEIERGQA